MKQKETLNINDGIRSMQDREVFSEVCTIHGKVDLKK